MSQEEFIEIWRDIPKYSDLYQVSNLGNIRSKDKLIKCPINGKRLLKSKLLSQQTTPSGYKRVTFRIQGKSYNYFVHRLVAEVFCKNTNNKPVVNHIDSDPLNNVYYNLEWCTQSENISHSYNKGRSKSPKSWVGKFGKNHNKSKTVIQYDLDGNFIAEYGSGMEAERVTGIPQSSISAVITNKQKQTKGYVFKQK